MNTITKPTSATENLQQQIKIINEYVNEETALRLRIAAAIKVRREFNEARSNLENAKSVRREILGTIHLSGKADHAKKELGIADTALRDAQQRAEELADSAEGAQFALDRLEPDAKSLHDQVIALRAQLPAMQLAAATEEAEGLVKNYIQVADSFEAAFASLAGGLMALEEMRHSDKPNFIWHELYPLEIEFPSPPYLGERFRAFRPHARVMVQAEAQRQEFIDRLQHLGILDA